MNSNGKPDEWALELEAERSRKEWEEDRGIRQSRVYARAMNLTKEETQTRTARDVAEFDSDDESEEGGVKLPVDGDTHPLIRTHTVLVTEIAYIQNQEEPKFVTVQTTPHVGAPTRDEMYCQTLSLSSGLSRALVPWQPKYKYAKSQQTSVSCRTVHYPTKVRARPEFVAHTPANKIVLSWLGHVCSVTGEPTNQRASSYISDVFLFESVPRSFELSFLEQCFLSVRDYIDGNADIMDQDFVTDVKSYNLFENLSESTWLSKHSKYYQGPSDECKSVTLTAKELLHGSCSILIAMRITRAALLTSRKSVDFIITKSLVSNLCDSEHGYQKTMLWKLLYFIETAQDDEVSEASLQLYRCFMDEMIAQLGPYSPIVLWFSTMYYIRRSNDGVPKELGSLFDAYWRSIAEDSPAMLMTLAYDALTHERFREAKELAQRFLDTLEDTGPSARFLRTSCMSISAQADYEIGNFDSAAEQAKALIEHWPTELEKWWSYKTQALGLLRAIKRKCQVKSSKCEFELLKTSSKIVNRNDVPICGDTAQ
ncbi:hypothetical protein H2198_006442 [Neophaeococcomyces mojaviensis]|uniref:Uncharacterized protein n=1 Tax=Neophaeococcomyces mojaviensis TaxID=3383035 RepID=A0ACC3A2U2_9EURO|nr:hypothetical protein H2198_006442 [Knufia sp. JES_112]